MAYTLRYYKTLPQPGDRDIILEIYEKDGAGASVEIGPVIQALHLDIQGSQEDIDTPVVKTSLVMTFVDAPDHEEASSKKCGNWEEFYTPDSTYWKVVLKKRTASGSFTPIWGGYVTPDSFTEQLRYRGSVTIVARDNIGHMQDFPFDSKGNEDGMITVYDLVNTAWAKIESPMSLNWRGEEDEAMWLQCDGHDVTGAYLNVSAFKGMNWYEAMEKVLYSIGAVMRYVGDNTVQVSSLRYMPYQGRASMSSLAKIEPKFIAHANRELVPAVRRIEESVKYDISEVLLPLVEPSDFRGDVINGNVWPLINTESGNGWCNVMPSTALYFNPNGYAIEEYPYRPAFEMAQEQIYDSMFLLCNTEGLVEYSQVFAPMEVTLEVGLGGNIWLKDGKITNTASTVIRARYAIKAFYNGIDYFLDEDGSWTESYVEYTATREGESSLRIKSISHSIPLQAFDAPVVLHFYILELFDLNAEGKNIYVQVQSLKVIPNDNDSLLQTNNVNTIYNNDNNVIISRDPTIGPAYDFVYQGIIKNGMFIKSGDVYLPAKAWAWSGGTPQQMAVYNHLQLLCYHAKPNNVITGDIVNADLGNLRALYMWHGSEHLLQGGSLNFLNGRIEGAILREFARYDEMWGDVTGDSMPATEQESSTNVEEGGSSSGSSATYDNTTNVTIGGSGGGVSVTVDTFLSDTSTNPVQNKIIKQYIDTADNLLDEKIGNLAEHIDDLESSKAVIFDATSSTDPWELNVLQTSTTIEEMAEAINNGSPIYMRFGSGLVSVANAELYDNGDVSLYVHLVDPEDVISRTIHTYSDGEDWYWESFDNPMGGSANPDEEDITTNEEGNLQFKDRDAINGMGYVILRKNVSLAEQMTKENTIYEVRYTYILEEDLTIPANCILRFVGGVILGSKTIIGNNTAIDAAPCHILGKDITLAGSWRVSESLPEWFGAKSIKGYLNNDLLYANELINLDNAQDSSKAINQALILSSLSGAVTVLNGGAYRTNRTIVIPSNVTLNLPTSSAIVPYMEGSGIMDEQKVYALAFDKFIPTSSMAVAVQMSSYSCRIVGHGTIALAKSRYTIGLHMLGQGWMPMDMAFSSSTDVIISGKTLRGGHYYSADTDTIIGEGEPLANEIAGAEGSTYLDTLTMVKHLWQNGGWTKAQNANHGYNTCFRVEIKGNDFRAINTRFSIWAIHCFRGIEVVTGEGGGWYNSAIWDGTISNMISSFLSIFRGPWIHDFEKINYQIDVNMCKDCKIVYCNIASFCKFGYTWDLAQVPAIAAIPRYYFGAGSSNNLLWLWSKSDLYEDNGNNNVIVPKERWVQAFALPKGDAKPVIIGQDYYNALKYRTPWTTFHSNWGKMYNGVIKSSQPLAEADVMAAISSYDYTDITNGTIPAVFFDEDMATSEEVLNDATQVYAFNLSSQTQMFRMSPCEEMYVELDYAIYDSAGELISGQTQEANIGLLVDAGEDTSVIPLTNNTFKGSGLAYTPRVSKAIITIPEGAVFYYSGIRVGVFFMEQTTGVKVVIYNVKLWKKTYNAGQIMGVERGMTSERPTAAPAGYIYYDTEIGKAIMNVGTSSAMEWKDLAAGGEGGGGGEDNEFITFASPSVAAKCSELYGNNDGKLSYAQAEAVTEIAEGAFRTAAVEGDFLEFVYFKNVTKIGAHGFRTSKLTSIRIPASVTSFGWGAFYQCGSLIKVIIDATTPPTLGGSDFASGNADRKIYVPDSAIDAYKTAWSAYASAIFGQSEL